MALLVKRSRPGELSELLRVAQRDVQDVARHLPPVPRGVQTAVKDPVAVEFLDGHIASARHGEFAPRADARAVHPATPGTPKLTVTTSDHPHAIRTHLPRQSIQSPLTCVRRTWQKPCKSLAFAMGFPSVLDLIVLRVVDALDNRQVGRAR